MEIEYLRWWSLLINTEKSLMKSHRSKCSYYSQKESPPTDFPGRVGSELSWLTALCPTLTAMYLNWTAVKSAFKNHSGWLIWGLAGTLKSTSVWASIYTLRNTRDNARTYSAWASRETCSWYHSRKKRQFFNAWECLRNFFLQRLNVHSLGFQRLSPGSRYKYISNIGGKEIAASLGLSYRYTYHTSCYLQDNEQR